MVTFGRIQQVLNLDSSQQKATNTDPHNDLLAKPKYIKRELYLGMLFLGSSLSFASPPKRYTLLPTMVKLWPKRGQGGCPILGDFGLNRFHSQRLAWKLKWKMLICWKMQDLSNCVRSELILKNVRVRMWSCVQGSRQKNRLKNVFERAHISVRFFITLS